MLALALGSAHRPPHRIIQAAELALGARIHVAHAGDDGVGLVVEIQAVGDQFFQLDLRRHLKRPAAAGTVAAPVTASIAAWTVTVGPIAWRPVGAFTTSALRRAAATLRTRRTIFAPRLPLSLGTLTLRTALRLGRRLLWRFGCLHRRLNRCLFCSSRRRWSFRRGRLRCGRLRRYVHFRLHI